jgi:hypothetical protein
MNIRIVVVLKRKIGWILNENTLKGVVMEYKRVWNWIGKT